MGDIRVSVVIPSRNEGRRLRYTVERLIKTRTGSFSLEIVVADDASKDGSAEILPRGRNNVVVRCVRSTARLGVPQARNLAAQHAQGEVLFITDAHVCPPTGWDERILSLVRPNTIRAATISDEHSQFRGYGCSLVVPFMGTRWNRVPHRRARSVHVASAAGTILPRTLFHKLGGYDQGMIVYGAAEPEFSVRAWLSGARILSTPSFTVRHGFKSRTAVSRWVRRSRGWMVHNNMRFGLLYLPSGLQLQLLRYYAVAYPRYFRRAAGLLLQSDLWNRRKRLRRRLQHDFGWFVHQFQLRDQIGRRLSDGLNASRELGI